MYCDSVCVKYGQGKLVYDYATTNAPGYIVGANNSFENDNGFSTGADTVPGTPPWHYGTYNDHGTYASMYNFFIASPSAYSLRSLFRGGGYYVGGIFTQSPFTNITHMEGATTGVCPIVCMDVDFSVFLQ